MNETELERLVVRLTGDATSYIKMLKESAEASQKTAHQIETAANKIEAFKGKMEGFGGTLGRAFGAVGIAVGFKESMHKFEEFEKNTIRMNAVLLANERNITETTKSYKEFAAEVNQSTLLTKGEVMGLLRQAETFDLTGAAAKKAAKDAAALAAVNDSSAESMIRMSAAMAKGDTERAMQFARMIPQLRGVKDETEFLAKYNKLVEAGTRTLGEEMETVSGRIEHSIQQFKTFSKEIGGAISLGIEPLARHLELYQTGSTRWDQRPSSFWRPPLPSQPLSLRCPPSVLS